jgi:hypothetical protein
MFAFVSYQSSLVTECLITQFTNIRALTTMEMSMSYQIAMLAECPITYFTNIRTLTTMFAFVSYQVLLSMNALLHTSQV